MLIYSLNSFESKFTANRVIKRKFGIKYDQTVLVKKVTFNNCSQMPSFLAYLNKMEKFMKARLLERLTLVIGMYLIPIGIVTLGLSLIHI